MDVDSSLKTIGLFGRKQNANFVLFGMCYSLAAVQLTAVAFTIDQSVKHYCKPPPEFTANETTPLKYNDEGQLVPDSCHMYIVENDTLTTNTTTCVDGFQYPATEAYGETSMVTDLNLVCDRRFLSGTLMSLHFGGVVVGGALTGHAADVFGRRVVVMLSQLLIGVIGIGLSFTWSFELMLALRFLLGVVLPGSSVSGYIRGVEMFTPKKRALGNMLSQNFWTIGVLVLALLAFLIPNWRRLQLVTSLCCLAILPFLWFFTYESLRWQVQKGHVEKAEAMLQKIAKSKNIEHSGRFLKPQENSTTSQNSSLEDVNQQGSPLKPLAAVPNKENSPNDQKGEALNDVVANQQAPERTMTHKSKTTYTVLDLFKTKMLIKRTCIIFYLWFAMNALYYGFIVYATSLTGNKYFNFFLLALVETPVYLVDFLIIRKFGRKRPLIIFYFAVAAACLITGFLPQQTAKGTDLTPLIIVMACLGKFYALATFELTMLVGAEIFPTMLRNTATGSAATVGRVSVMIAPFVVYLKDVRSFLPMTLFACLSIVAGALVFLLPETKNRPLPETYEDACKLEKNENKYHGI